MERKFYREVKKELKKYANPKKAKLLAGFFKTRKGEYGFGDRFLGVTVPQSRHVVKKYANIPLADVGMLLRSRLHEERLVAVLLLVKKFQHGNEPARNIIFRFYLRNTRYINNWDLVDLSADRIVGAYLETRPRERKVILEKLAQSTNLWERRIAILSTFWYIYHGSSADTFTIATILLRDPHDLIHKAVGWMLREVGKRVSKQKLERFLARYAKKMPRTMLRYAIERFPERERKRYLKIKRKVF